MSRNLLISITLLLLAAPGCSDDDAGLCTDDCGAVEPDAGMDVDASGDAGWDAGDATVGDAAEVADAADGADAVDGGDGGEADGASDADAEPDAPGPSIDEWPVIAHGEAMPGLDPEAWDPLASVPAGESRGGRVRAGQRAFDGPEARCRPGDFVLANEHIRVCIAAEPAISQMHYTGGQIIDMEPVADPGGDVLETFSPSVSALLSASADTVALLRDGTDGGPAIVRTDGIDVILKIVGNVVGNLVASQNLHFITEYRLAPGDPRLEAVTWISLERDVAQQPIEGGDLFLPGDVPRAWIPGSGFEPLMREMEAPFYVATAPGRSYGIWSETLTITTFAGDLLDAPISPARMTRGMLGRGDEATYRRYFVVGDGSTTSIRDAFGDLLPDRGGAPVVFTRSVSEFDTDLRYEVLGAGGSIDVIEIGADGTTAVTLPEGDYEAVPLAATADASAPTAFSVPADGPIALPVPDFGVLEITVTALDGEAVVPSPARVRLTGPTYLEHLVVRGEARIQLSPGTYTVEVSRGDEYDFVEFTDIDIVSGETAALDAELVRLWDTVGWVSGDMHQHAVRSIDSTVPPPDRVIANLAAGVDFIAPTDHDVLEDFVRVVAELGVDDLLHTYLGLEVSPAWGHMNVFPMTYDPSLTGAGAVPLSFRGEDGREIIRATTNELVASARELGADIVQINHPRGSQGLFGTAGYDPVTGPEATDPEFWPSRFDSMEIYNDQDMFCEIFRDWTSLLSRGYRVSGVGNSDTHSLSSPSGYPRNFVVAPTDDPAEITDEMITAAIAAQNVSVSGGIFIDFPDGEIPGEILPVSPGETYPLRVRVQTTAWAGVDALVVLVDGAETDRVDLTSISPEGIVAYDDVVNLTVGADAYVIFIGYSADRMSQVTPGEFPFGFTNPLFLDVGDDGWTAPGVEGEEDVPPLTGIPFCR